MEVIVEYDYKADELDELTIKKGEIIKNVSQFEDGWYIGTLNGKTGVFPDNFVKKLTSNPSEERTTRPVAPTENESRRVKESLSANNSPTPTQSKKVIGIGLGNIFSGQQIQLKQLSVTESKMRIQHENGKKEEEKRNSEKEDADERVRVKFAYSPKQPDEIALNIDDIIVILDKNLPDEGWWKGCNQSTKATGLFPDNFVEPIPQQKQDAMMRATPSSMVNARSHPSLLVQSPSEKSLPKATKAGAKVYKNSDLFPANEMSLEHPITPMSKINSKYQGSSDKNRETSDQNYHAERNGEKFSSSQSLVDVKQQHQNFEKVIRDYQELQLELRETKAQMQNLKKQSNHLEESNENLILELNRTQKAFTERIQSLMAEIDEVKKSRAIDVIELKRVKTILMQIDAKYLSKGLESQVNGGDDLHVNGNGMKNANGSIQSQGSKSNGIFAGGKR